MCVKCGMTSYMLNRALQLRQRGYGLQYYRGHGYRQKGRGLGSFFGNVVKHLVPFAKNTILPAAKKYILPHAKEMLMNVASDVLAQKQSIGESFRQHGLDALKAAGTSFVNQSGSGYHRINTRKRKRSDNDFLPKNNKIRKISASKKSKFRKPQTFRSRSRRDIFAPKW